jgi:hypothetical protein
MIVHVCTRLKENNCDKGRTKGKPADVKCVEPFVTSLLAVQVKVRGSDISDTGTNEKSPTAQSYQWLGDGGRGGRRVDIENRICERYPRRGSGDDDGQV